MKPILARIAHAMHLIWLCCMGLLLAPAAHAVPANPSALHCSGKDLVFVAHLDDDLLFMNPDISAGINAGGCVLTVYLTASERGEGEGYMLGRERGVRAAYAYLANAPNLWTEDTVAVGAYHLARFTLQGNPKVQLLHMRLKDPWLGKGWGSLTPLSRTESVAGATVDTLGAYHETYTRSDLVATIASLIQSYHPTTIRHLDDTILIPYTKLCWRCAGHGHPDHIASARLVRDAVKAAPGHYAEVGYIGYPSQEREANLDQQEMARKTEAFRRYAWNDYRYCAGPQNCQEPAGPAAAWVGRSYYVSRDNTTPDLFADRQGGILILATGENNDAANIWDSRTQRWGALGGRTADPLASFMYPDTSIGFFARDTLGDIWANKQNLDKGWRGWRAIAGARFFRTPTVASQGRTAAVALATDGLLYWTSPSGTENHWANWQPLPVLAQPSGDAAISTDKAGRLEIFATDTDGRLFVARQDNAQDPDHWSSWQHIQAPAALGGLAAIRNPHDQIELYLRDRHSNHLLRMVQAASTPDAADGTAALAWNPPADLGLEFVGRPAVGLNERGEVAVAVLERPGGALWLLENAQARKLTTNVASAPAMRVMDGALYVVARNAGKLQTYQIQERRAGTWASALTVNVPPAGGGSAFVQTIPDMPGQAVAVKDTSAVH